MRKRVLPALLALIICAGAILPFTVLPADATGTHGFYMNCDASVTNHKTDGFMIDFFTDSTDALGTYWSNANWNMYTAPSVTKLGYNGITGGGAYAGLQHNNAAVQRAGIMSMWRWEYRDREGNVQYLYADTMVGDSSQYHNEGSGTSCILPYAWESGKWYRELLFCWDDEETGYTMIGTWFYDYGADEWSLFTYYNTYLVDSYINTNIDQFLENYTDRFNNRYRSFRYRNVYFLGHGTEQWVSQPRVKVFTDDNADAVGVCSMGIADDGSYVWGAVDGRNGQNVPTAGYQKTERTYTLDQPAQPTVGQVWIESFDASDPSAITWTVGAHSTPQLSYGVTVTDLSGSVLVTLSGTRPEVRALQLPELGTDAYKCTLTVTDVFGQTATAEATSPAYDELTGGGSTAAVDWFDVNVDGGVNIGDVTALLDVLSGSAAEIDADVSGDGLTNISDVTALLDHLSGAADVGYSKGLNYTLNGDGTYTVSGVGSCADKRVRIPERYAGKSVTAIGPYAFAHCTGLESVSLPASVTEIGVYAFAACTSLESVSMPPRLSSLGQSAFAGCPALSFIAVPEGLTEIARYTFEGCASLESVTLPAALLRVYESAFGGCAALETVNYTGTRWSAVRIYKNNDPLFAAEVVCENPQEPKNGFVQEDGGVRYYLDGVMQTGWLQSFGNDLYFCPDTGLMATNVVLIDGAHCSFSAYEYDGLTLWKLDGGEPDKETRTQDWVEWLLNIDSVAETPVYRQLQTGSVVTCRHPNTSDPSGWNLSGGYFRFNLRIDKEDADFTENIGSGSSPYSWEIFYRAARSEDDYLSVRTSPRGAQNDGGAAVYRIDTYSAGMDLSTAEDGSPREYEFVFVVYKDGAAPGDIVGWKQVWAQYTDSSEAYKADALFSGALVLPDADPFYDEGGRVRPESASCSGLGGFGEISDPVNVLDGNEDSVCGSGFNGSGSQFVKISFKRPEMLTKVFIQCKNEGSTTNADGSRGTYDLYAVYGGEDVLLASGVPAVTGADGGYTLVLDSPVPAEGVKAVITSWQGDCWACVADLLAYANGDTPAAPKYDSEGHILNMTASRAGFADFGEINKPENVLDGDQSTVCGSGFDASALQSVTVAFPEPEYVTEVFIQCKNEGSTTHPDGKTRGTYSVYALYGDEVLLAENVPARTGSDGGYTLTLSAPVPATGVKVVITSWQGDRWACVADIAVKASGQTSPAAPTTDSEGHILNMTASCAGFADFGSVNKPENVLDGDQNTVCGSGFSSSTEQSVTVSFPQEENVAEVFIQCKNEGATTHPDGKTRGTYSVYALLDGEATLLASGVPARTGTDGGYTVTLDTPVPAAAVKVVITSWQGDCWACVADIAVKAET